MAEVLFIKVLVRTSNMQMQKVLFGILEKTLHGTVMESLLFWKGLSLLDSPGLFLIAKNKCVANKDVKGHCYTEVSINVFASNLYHGSNTRPKVKLLQSCFCK